MMRRRFDRFEDTKTFVTSPRVGGALPDESEPRARATGFRYHPALALGARIGRNVHRAFTIIELVVVIGIISLLAAISLPGISNMWRENHLADTDAKIKGLIKSAHARARNNREETGLFFYLENGVQKVVFIKADPPDYTPLPGPDGVIGTRDDVTPDLGAWPGVMGGGDDVTEPDAADRFRVVAEDKVYRFPPPFRVVPREILDVNAAGNYIVWTDDMLANEEYRTRADPNSPRSHRNFFTVIFSPSGRLRTRSVVLIRDGVETRSTSGLRSPEQGLMTGLVIDSTLRYVVGGMVGGLGGRGRTNTFPSGAPLPAMIIDSEDNAINFPSVDGLLIYDDSVFVEFPQNGPGVFGQRDYLKQSSKPRYITRQTGALIRGPLADSEPKS